MKKLFLTLLGVAFVAGSASAQMGMAVTPAKVDVAKLRAAIAKSDAEVADAKKALKAATWIARGETLVDVDAKPVNGVYGGMPEDMLKATYGDAAPADVTVGGNPYKVYSYDNFKAYVSGGAVAFFTATTVIDPAALDKAYDAFAKAYDMDVKTAKKAGAGMDNIHNKSFENGSAFYSLGEYNAAAENFRRAYRASVHRAASAIDTMALYYAGMSAINEADYAASLRDLEQVIGMGYESEGEAYYLKFLAQYNLGDKENSLETLKAGLSRFPTNENIMDMMMRYYAENDGDASSVIPMVQAAIAQNPTNPSLYQGLARVYDKLGRSDEAISTIRKAVELTPNDFLSNYLEGFFIIKKGDAANIELGSQTFTSSAQYQEALAGVNDIFKGAMAPLERAFEINPSQLATVELLKNLTFRLREDPAMSAKYDKYNALFNSME